jgi:hypothetical protein
LADWIKEGEEEEQEEEQEEEEQEEVGLSGCPVRMY